tara:strand:+ start:102 stop:1331 length:1230 start_codon:yes stop_codon:yes gene_type:complete
MIFYRVITFIIIFFLPVISIYRILKKKDTFGSLKEKIGFYSKLPKGNLIWFHGSSVGEVLSIIPLVRELEKKNDLAQILITSNTLSSAKVLKNLKFKKTIHQFFPIDANFIVKRFLKYWKPKACIFIESEIWPNVIRNIKKQKLPLILLNARITNKSYKRWKKINSFSNKLFSMFDLCLPQNKETFKYLKKLGSKKIKLIGNLKLCEIKEENSKKLNSSQMSFLRSKKVLFTGLSTHYSEETFCTDLFLNLRRNKNEILILIPRHVERTDLIEKDLREKKLVTHKHSSKRKINKKTDVYLVDTYGEAKKFLGLSKVIFTGGSLISHGGQNPLDAVRNNSIVIHGPSIYNFTEIYKFLSKEKMSFKFKNLNQAIKLVKNRNLNNRNTKTKLSLISQKILNKTKIELFKYV